MGVKKTVIRGRGIGGAAEIRPGSGAQGGEILPLRSGAGMLSRAFFRDPHDREISRPASF